MIVMIVVLVAIAMIAAFAGSMLAATLLELLLLLRCQHRVDLVLGADS